MKSRNPLLPPEYFFPDGEPHLIDGEMYVYPSCDADIDRYCSDKLYAVHSRNLQDWCIEGPIFDCADLNDINMPKLPENFGGGLLYAPDSLTVNGRSYLFFCTSDGYEGVAFSDSPSGPFSSPVLITGDKTGEYIKGIDEIESYPWMIHNAMAYHPGDCIPETAVGTLIQLQSRIHVCGDTIDELIKNLEILYDLYHVYDDRGTEMILTPHDMNELRKSLSYDLL